MQRRWSFYKDVLPLLMIIGYQFIHVSILTLFKAATEQGMNKYVFVAYSYAVAATIHFPVAFYNRRSRVLPPLSISIISKIFLLGIIGSPTLASSIGNLVPAFTFMLAVICRMEKIAAKSSSQAKVVGSIISIAGAFVLTLYKGPSIINTHIHHTLPLQQPINFLKSEDANWIIAGILLTADCLLISETKIVGMARRWSFYMDLLPIVVIIGNHFSQVGLLTLFKAATLKGMNQFLFVAYSYAIGTTILFPVTLYHRRSRVVPPLGFSIISKIVLIGVIGSSSQILGYVGISYSSPTLASSIGNLMPAFTFMLAVICRMEKIAAKSRSSQAKVVGSIISIAGASVLTLYKGPSIINAHIHHSLPLQQPISFLNSEDANWAIAGILLTAECLLLSVMCILQVNILMVFPDEVTMVFIYIVTATILSTIVAFCTVPNPSAWKIGSNISLISILCTGIFKKLIGSILFTWVLRLKGAVYVTSFKPFQIVIAAAMGVMFLGDALHVGSIVGAIIISVGLYAVLWGKAAEEIEEEEDIVGSLESPTIQNVPLLQSYTTETFEKKTDGNV